MIFAAHAAAVTTVSVDAPEYVPGNTFDVEIMIENVDELDSGEFHLIYDPNVVNVTDVVSGIIDDKTVEIKGVADTRYNKIRGIGIIRVLFDVNGTDGASSSGIISTISFEVTGGAGNCSFLNISNPTPIRHIEGFGKGKLVPWGPDDDITANWVNDRVCIGNPPDSGTTNSNTSESRVTVYVNNRDNDPQYVKLSIDGVYKYKNKKVQKNSEVDFDSYPLEGFHIFTIEWNDRDTGKDYIKSKKYNVVGETAITLFIDEHTEDDADKLIAYVHVKNLDDEDLDEVHLYIDGKYKKFKSISSGSVGDYGEYEFEEDEDTLHSFKIEWFDPGTDETYEKIVRSYITGEEVVTLYVDKHTKEDIILLSEAASTPVSTIPKSSSTSARTAKEPTPTPTKTQITELHTDPALAQDSSEGGDMGQHISVTCTLLAFVAVLFVLMQIRRI